MLSPAFESAAYLPITLLPPLSPAPFSPSPLSQVTTSSCNSTARNYPRSPCTPRANTPRPRLSAVLASSPYFSPSNPFSARPALGALSARHAIINTLSAPIDGCTTPSLTPRAEARGDSRTLRQRGRVDIQDNQVAFRPLSLGSDEGVKENTGVKAVGKRMVGMAGWVILGMVISLAVLSVRAGLEASGGSAGGVGTVHISWDTQARARAADDVWAITELREQVEDEWAGAELRSIWAS